VREGAWYRAGRGAGTKRVPVGTREEQRRDPAKRVQASLACVTSWNYPSQMADPPARPPFKETWRHPRLWPVRWRLTAVSAILTFLILVTFAVVVGRLAENRIRHDFENEIAESAQGVANEISASPTIQTLARAKDQLEQMAPPPAVLRLDPNCPGCHALVSPADPGDLGPTTPGVRRVGNLEVATAPVPGFGQAVLQYARPADSVDETINKLWLFLFSGVLGGTLLATLAGLAVASRAMRPIAALTATAREIADTRDPSRRVPQPESDDEVAELAMTLDQMLRELDAARTETDQMMQAQREFVADASHELRTPLTSILANLELLQARLDDAERRGEEGEIIDGALRSSRRMGRLVSDLLLLARADAGRMGVRRECDLAEITEAALAEVKPLATEHQLSLQAPEPVPVMGNPDELHRLVLNLLDNALRHTPAGTRVGLSVTATPHQAVLAVEDDGPGLPTGMDEQIFGRFVRGSGPADLSNNGGIGLGLAIVQAVATSHGGAVEAGASAHGGARFTVRLPLDHGGAPQPLRAPSEASASF
jgi:two-component system, OmpR family, sensor kinase